MTTHDTENHSCVKSECTTMDKSKAAPFTITRYRPKQARSDHAKNIAAREEDAARVAWCAEDPMR